MSSSNAHDLRSPWLQRQTDRFAERNLPLFALLGLVCRGEQLEALIARVCSEPASEPAQEPEPLVLEDAVVIDTVLDFILGVVATSRRVRNLADAWARAATPAHAPNARAADSRRELLR